MAAIVRSSKEERAMIELLDRISGEIIYLIDLPTGSLLSKNYFFVRTDFNLMCIPLMESSGRGVSVGLEDSLGAG